MLEILSDEAQWQNLNVKLPPQIARKNHFQIMPVWKYPFKNNQLNLNEILIFGGHQKDIFVMNTDNYKIKELVEDGVFFDT